MKAWLKGVLVSFGLVLIVMISVFVAESRDLDLGKILSMVTISPLFFIVPLIFGAIVGFVYDKMYSDERRLWLNGIVYGMITGAILTIIVFSIWAFIEMRTCGEDDITCGIAPGVVFIFSIFPMVIFLGIIGGFIGKIVSR